MEQNKNTKYIYADLMKVHQSEEEILLNTVGTKKDLEEHGINFEEGKEYWFWTDDKENDPLIFSGIVRFDLASKEWIAKIDLQAIKHLSEI